MVEYDFEDAIRIIRDRLAGADTAAQHDPSVREHYRRAGALLIEAYPQLTYTEWPGWLKRHFGITVKEAERYMALARTDSLRAFLRKGNAV
jgi:hypothetical protein